jgi:hypothetical protein
MKASMGMEAKSHHKGNQWDGDIQKEVYPQPDSNRCTELEKLVS